MNDAKQNHPSSYYSKHEGSFNLIKDENNFYMGSLKAALYGNAGAVAITLTAFVKSNCKWHWTAVGALLSFIIGYVISGLAYKVSGYAQGQYKFALRSYEDNDTKKMKEFTADGNKLRARAIQLNNLSFLMLFIGGIFALIALFDSNIIRII